MKTKRYSLKSVTYRDLTTLETNTLLYATEKTATGKELYYAQEPRERLDKLGVIKILDTSNFGTINSLEGLWLQPIEPVKTVYERVQQYGGPEEGGWYYHTLEVTELLPNCVLTGHNDRGEGYEIFTELIRGFYEDVEKQYYS